MKIKGYIYNDAKNTYVKKPKEITAAIDNSDKTKEHAETTTDSIGIKKTTGLPEEYRLILEMLHKNKQKLVNLLMTGVGKGKIPRYMLGGISTTKSIHMNHNLSQLVKDYSMEKGIPQREIFEVAVLEFLKRYDFEREVEVLLEH